MTGARPPRIVAVTGAAGGVGSAVCARLRAAGIEVHALILATDDGARIEPLARKLVRASIEDADALRDLLAGVDGVIHCAGLLPNSLARGRDAFMRVNVDGAVNVLRAAHAQGVRHAIYFSTFGVVDHTHPTSRDELFRYRTGDLDAYAESKIESEKQLIAAAKSFAVDVALVRPTFIYGPTTLGIWNEALDTVKQGRMKLPGSGDAVFPLVHADDLADYAIELLGQPPVPGRARVLIATDPTPITTREFFGIIADHFKVAHPRAIPSWIVYPAAVIAEALPRALRLGPAKLLTKRRVREYSKGYDLRAVLGSDHFGFKVRTPIASGMSRMLAAYDESRRA